MDRPTPSTNPGANRFHGLAGDARTAPLASPARNGANATNAERLLKDGVTAMEPLRKRWLKLFLLTWGVTLALGVVSIGLFHWMKESIWVWSSAALATLFAGGALGQMSSREGEQLRDRFSTWRDGVLSHLEEGASLAPRQYLDQGAFDASWLNHSHFNTYRGENLLRVGGLSSCQLDVKHIYEETYYETVYSTDSQGQSSSTQVQRTRTVVVPVFGGLFLMVPARLPRPGTVLLRQELGPVASTLHRIKVASPHLNKAYVIGASDPFVGHRVLTPTLMESLWDFRLKSGSNASFSYRDGWLYIAVPGFALRFGEAPGMWTAVTLAKLNRVLSACEASLRFLKSTAETLRPPLLTRFPNEHPAPIESS